MSLNWITPNVQKGVAIAFVISWYLAQGRFPLFWKAVTGQVKVSANA